MTLAAGSAMRRSYLFLAGWRCVRLDAASTGQGATQRYRLPAKKGDSPAVG